MYLTQAKILVREFQQYFVRSCPCNSGIFETFLPMNEVVLGRTLYLPVMFHKYMVINIWLCVSNYNGDLRYNETSHVLNYDKPYECLVCSKKFKSKNHLNNHIITHSGEKPFECQICNKKFASSDYLRSHLHMRTHTGEKPFECTVCSKKFPTSGALSLHLRTHTGEKPFKCTVCGTRFTQQPNLVHHLRTHTGEKPFKCTVCDAMFSTLCGGNVVGPVILFCCIGWLGENVTSSRSGEALKNVKYPMKQLEIPYFKISACRKVKATFNQSVRLYMWQYLLFLENTERKRLIKALLFLSTQSQQTLTCSCHCNHFKNIDTCTKRKQHQNLKDIFEEDSKAKMNHFRSHSRGKNSVMKDDF
ncbi:zinc finger protein 606-like [Thrips palmi]|uniref:Zinc finger protein 606-like n=1 Tax=Thrips palmi TaxID=161013 RepID=A0A6P8YLF8_THRPL|nr:zinc finger protein 606-like [Thrips palmi]